MATLTAGTAVTLYSAVDGTLTITPGTTGRVSFNGRNAISGAAVTPREIYSVTDITLAAGDRVTLEAVSTDATYSSVVQIRTIDGGVVALSEAVPSVALTATGTAFTGACEFRGIKVRALVGGPQTATIYDATSATGTPIDTVVFNALGTWLWDRPSDVLPGVGGRLPCTTGVHVVFSGGTSRTVDVMVGAV